MVLKDLAERKEEYSRLKVRPGTGCGIDWDGSIDGISQCIHRYQESGRANEMVLSRY